LAPLKGSGSIASLAGLLPVPAAAPAAASLVPKVTAGPARVAAFLALPEAVGREDFARHMADDLSLSIETARRALATMPRMAERSADAAPAPKPAAQYIAESWTEIIDEMNAATVFR
jgi:hypothetical protein